QLHDAAELGYSELVAVEQEQEPAAGRIGERRQMVENFRRATVHPLNRMKGYITVRRRGKPGVARCGPGARSSMNRDRRISHEATKARSYQMFLRVFVSSWRPAAVLIQRGRSTSRLWAG